MLLVPKLPEFASIREAAKIAGRSEWRIRAMVAQGHIDHETTPGGHVKIPLAEVSRLLRRPVTVEDLERCDAAMAPQKAKTKAINDKRARRHVPEDCTVSW